MSNHHDAIKNDAPWKAAREEDTMTNPPEKASRQEEAALTTEPPDVRVDWAWAVSVERVLEPVPDLFTWANAPHAE